MLIHCSALCSAVTAMSTLGIQSGKFITRPRFSQTTKWRFKCMLVQHSTINWHWSISCVASDERNKILLAIEEYHEKTPIRFKQYDPLTDSDYIHITGELSGCWSFVGRIGGVSNRVQGVVRTSAALRTAPFGLRRFTTNTQTHTG